MEGKRQEKKNVDEDPEEGGYRKARGEAGVEKEELAHCVACSTSMKEENIGRE